MHFYTIHDSSLNRVLFFSVQHHHIVAGDPVSIRADFRRDQVPLDPVGPLVVLVQVQAGAEPTSRNPDLSGQEAREAQPGHQKVRLYF